MSCCAGQERGWLGAQARRGPAASQWWWRLAAGLGVQGSKGLRVQGPGVQGHGSTTSRGSTEVQRQQNGHVRDPSPISYATRWVCEAEITTTGPPTVSVNVGDQRDTAASHPPEGVSRPPAATPPNRKAGFLGGVPDRQHFIRRRRPLEVAHEKRIVGVWRWWVCVVGDGDRASGPGEGSPFPDLYKYSE